jgi:uncharacterized protein (DUF1800 family)
METLKPAMGHLLRRAGFGASPAEASDWNALSLSAAIDALVDYESAPDDVDAKIGKPGFLGVASTGDFDPNGNLVDALQRWVFRMVHSRRPLQEKMALFWHNHFATGRSKVMEKLSFPGATRAFAAKPSEDPDGAVGQIELFRANALGNFRDLLLAVSQDPAMVAWLDGETNIVGKPQENYAREVMELFALGLGAYTEDDVKEVARAFTGWTLDKTQQAVFVPARHDDGLKTVLGKTGAFGPDDAIAIIVAQPIHQRFIARKLLEFFVYSDPEPELTEALAQVYALSGGNIAKTVGTIFRSNVFYSPRAYRAIPKSPIELAIGTLRYIGAQSVPPNLPYQLARMGQEPLNPPSVKGWDAGPAWINTSTLLARFNFVNALIAQTAPGKTGQPAVPAPNVAPDDLVRRAGMDPGKLAATIVAGVVQDDVTSDVRATLVAYLSSQTPSAGMQNPQPFGPENYQDKIRGALALALNLPVNQLD